jgi:hypothetical protein
MDRFLAVACVVMFVSLRLGARTGLAFATVSIAASTMERFSTLPRFSLRTR